MGFPEVRAQRLRLLIEERIHRTSADLKCPALGVARLDRSFCDNAIISRDVRMTTAQEQVSGIA